MIDDLLSWLTSKHLEEVTRHEAGSMFVDHICKTCMTSHPSSKNKTEHEYKRH